MNLDFPRLNQDITDIIESIQQRDVPATVATFSQYLSLLDQRIKDAAASYEVDQDYSFIQDMLKEEPVILNSFLDSIAIKGQAVFEGVEDRVMEAITNAVKI